MLIFIYIIVVVCGEGVSMEELDALQLELELLLSSVLVRHISFKSQLGMIDQLEKGKLPPKVVSNEDYFVFNKYNLA